MPAGCASDLANKPPDRPGTSRRAGRSGETGLIARPHDATAARSETAERGEYRWGLRARSRSSPSRNGLPHQQYLPAALGPKTSQAGAAERGLYPGEPENCRRSLRPFLRNLAFLGLLLIVFKVYRIEERAYQGRAFQTLATLAFLALPVHYLGPYRFKKPLFLAISMAGLFWVFGAYARGDRARLRLGLDRRLLSADPVVVPRRDHRGDRRGLRDRTPGNGQRRSFPTASGRSWHRCSCFG